MTAGERKPLSVSLARGLVLRLAGAFLGFVVTVVLARVLGAGEFGAYAYALALVSVLAVPATAGVAALVVREGGRSWSENGPGRDYRAVLAFGVGAILFYFGLVLAPILYGVMAGFEGRLPLDAAALWVALALVLGLSLLGVVGSMFRVAGRPTTSQMGPEVLRPVALLGLVAGMLWLGSGLAGRDALVLHALAVVLVTALMFGVFRAQFPGVAGLQFPKRDEIQGWHSALWFMGLSAGLYGVVQSLDFLMLGWFEPVETVGVYRVAVQLVFFVALGLKVVEVVLSAPVAGLCRSGEKIGLARLAALAPLFAIGLALPVVLGLVFAGEWFLLLAFGKEYQDAWLPLVILAVGKLVYLALAPAGMFLNMGGHEGWPLWTGGLALVVNAVLNALLIPIMGAPGAALATVTAFVVWGFMLWVGARLHLGVSVNPFRLFGEQGAFPALGQIGHAGGER